MPRSTGLSTEANTNTEVTQLRRFLSHRETESLEHIGYGKSNKEIAKLLVISDQTIKNHITLYEYSAVDIIIPGT